MPKKVVNIVKKGKNDKQSSASKEIFNLNEEIIIGINSKNIVNNSKKSDKKGAIKRKSKNKKTKQSQNSSKVCGNKKARRAKDISNKSMNGKRKKSHTILKILIIIFLLVLSVVLILLSPMFSIRSIVVENNNKVSDEEIISLSQINLNENIFKYINIDIMEKVKVNPYIEDVAVTRNYPSEIVISVKERIMEYALKFSDMYVYINNQGYVLERINEKYDLPEIIGVKTEDKDLLIGNRVAEEDLEQLEKINQISNLATENGIDDKIISYTIEEDLIKIALVGEKTAYIENFTNLNIKILSLKTVLERTEGKSGEIFLDGQGKDKSILFRESI